MIDAVYSPFQSTDLNVDIAAGYVKDAKDGYFVRSWIHLDPQNVKIIETENGSARIHIEAVCVTSDLNGKIVDSKLADFSLTGFNVDWIKKPGIQFLMQLPMKKPGHYYVRISIRDTASGKVGSAYQFLEITDLKKKDPALSSIFMITDPEDLLLISSKENAGEAFSPVFRMEEVRSPALRTYKPGDILHAFGILYNAGADAINSSEIETQVVLYKDGEEFMRGKPAPIDPNKAEDPDSILLLNKLTAGTPGNYVLQMIVTDKKNSKNNGTVAVQTLNFTVVENQACDADGNVRAE